MFNKIRSIGIIVLSLFCASCTDAQTKQHQQDGERNNYPMKLSEAEWKKKLTPGQYAILRQQSTERAFTGESMTIFTKKAPITQQRLCNPSSVPLLSSIPAPDGPVFMNLFRPMQ